MGIFQEHHSTLVLHSELVSEGKLRRAQLGAAFGIGSHFARTDVAAQIVLPTGVGKTAVISIAPFLLQCERCLVVTPTRLVRDQVAREAKGLHDMRNAGVVPQGVPKPKVVRQDKRATSGHHEEWREADVVVGLPAALAPSYEGVDEIPENMFDLVLFDEAHHLPARTWSELHDALRARSVLFTATPFRRDGKRLPGDIAFAYPLARAIEDGVYQPVTFIPVEPGDEGKDRALADRAKQELETEAHQEAQSRVLARADRVADAKRLVDIYEEVGLPVAAIHGGTSGRTLRAVLTKVKNGDLMGIACVSALTEGFDLPQLKVAVYHSPHKTLEPTLQFVGRVSRQGVAGSLLAVRDDVTRETADLYSEDRAWADLLPEMVDTAIESERQTRQFAQRVRKTGPIDLPPLALAPSRAVRVFMTRDEDLDLDIEPPVLGGFDVVSRFYDPDSNLLALVTRAVERPRWMQTDLLDSESFELHIAVLIPDHNVLFLSSERPPRALKELRQAIGAENAQRVGPEDLQRLLWASDIGAYHSVGMRETRPGRARDTSYRMSAGSRVELGISESDAQGATLGHLMGRRGQTGTFGLSVDKSKIWEPESTHSLLEFRQWCQGLAEALIRPANHPGLPGLKLSLGESYSSFPDRPLAAVLSGEMFLELRVRRDDELLAPDQLDIAVDQDEDELSLALVSEDEEALWRGRQTPGGRVQTEESEIQVIDQRGELVDPADALELHPPSIFFADGSMTSGSVLVPPGDGEATLPADVSRGLSWTGVEIEREVTGDNNVQIAALRHFQQGADFVVKDHGGYEMADFIVVTLQEGIADVALVHCKASSEPRPGHRVEDLYDVLGQAVRSTRWARQGSALWSGIIGRIQRRYETGIVSGDVATALARLNEWAQEPPMVEFSIWAVQPGLRVSEVPDWSDGKVLLISTLSWCADHGARFLILGHEDD